jgi:Na+/H+ antiporter NhaD/arsenite permease-like protein
VVEPWTQVSPAEGVSGFASTATITVLAMFVLSYGVQRTDGVQILGRKIAALTREDEGRQLGATIGVAGSISGFINTTSASACTDQVAGRRHLAGTDDPQRRLAVERHLQNATQFRLCH